MFVKHLTNREYQMYSNTSVENKDPDAFTNHYLVRISSDEIRIVTKKGLEKIRKNERKKIQNRRKIEKYKKDYKKENIEKE